MRRVVIASVLTLSVTLPSAAQEAKPATAAAPPKAAAASPGAPATEKDRTLYALGIVISRNLASLSLSKAELAVVEQGISDGVLGRTPKVDLDTYGPKLQDFAKTRLGAAAAAEKKAGAAYLAAEASQAGARKEPSGFVYKETKAGTGPSPKATDRVTVHYKGMLVDGTVFDSSISRGEPVTFELGGVIPCWAQGLLLMKTGGTARLICPSDLAYGDQGRPPLIKPGSTLVFDVQLLAIEKEAPPAGTKK